MSDITSRQSAVQDAVIREGITALSLLVGYIEQLWAHRPAPPRSGYVLVSHAEIPSCLFQIGLNFGMASTILFDFGPKRSSENKQLFELRCIRLRMVTEACVGIDLSIFSNRKLRNKLIHIDEHLARTLMESIRPSITDLAFSDRGCMHSPDGITYCRVYEFDSDSFLHLGEELDVQVLHQTAVAILARISQSGHAPVYG